MRVRSACAFAVVLAAALLPRAQAASFDAKVCTGSLPSWSWSLGYDSYCLGYQGGHCPTARDEDACLQGRRDRSTQTTADARRSVGDLRERVLRLPALPPERNPLLGRWRRVTPGGAVQGGGGLGQLMAMAAAGPCGMLLGSGVIEFTAGELFSTDASGRDSLGRVQYRMQGNRAYAVPQPGAVQLLAFEILGPDRIREALVGGNCTLVRVGPPGSSVAAPAPAHLSSSPHGRGEGRDDGGRHVHGRRSLEHPREEPDASAAAGPVSGGAARPNAARPRTGRR